MLGTKVFEKQNQSVEGSSTAIQAGGNVLVINTGVSAGEARQIALDVYRANSIEFQDKAIAISRQRVEEVTEKFFEKLSLENPAGINQARSPDFQDAMFTVQKEYAKADDKELGDLLVDLLVDRTKEKSRSILQIVLNESIHTAPKLTTAQTATLSVMFFLRYVRHNYVNNIEQLAAQLNSAIGSAALGFSTNASTFNHLVFTGCASPLPMSQMLETIFVQTYPGLFTAGFDRARLDLADISARTSSLMIIPCLDDSNRNQVAALNQDVFEEKITPLNLLEDEKGRLVALFSEGMMLPDMVRSKLVLHAPFLEKIFASWLPVDGKNAGLGQFHLTSVGMAIGHANIKRHIGEFAPLSIWIN